MKLFALATAATLALATSASAMTASQIEVRAQQILDQNGFSVDAGDLTVAQRYHLSRVGDNSERGNFTDSQRIFGILND